MTVDEVVEYTKIQAEEPTWGERLVEAFKESWEDFAVGFQNFTVGFLYAIPTLLVLSVIAVAVILILRVIIRRQRAAYEARCAERENKK
jgi:hypothetical protein